MQPLLAITGILTRASEAKEKTEEAQEKEGLELAVTSSQMEDVNTLEITEEKLSDAIKQQFGNNKDFSITDNRDGSFLVNMNDTNRIYYVDETGEVITEENMLKITTADELKAFRDDVNSGNTYEGWYVYLANDITLDINEEWKSIGFYTSSNLEQNIEFQGIFDGTSHNISGLNINNANENYQGLFAYNGGKIKNVNISEDSYINGGITTGSIVAYNVGSVENCIVKSTVTTNGNNAGGVVGTNNGIIRSCLNYGTIVNNAGQTIGGIVGWNRNNGIIEFSTNYTSFLTDYQFTGGIAGSNEGIVRKCSNFGKIESNWYIVGGICGTNQNGGQVYECFNTEKVNSNYSGNTGNNSNVGGIVGTNRNNSVISECYNIGTISSTFTNVGGIFGYGETNSITKNCYNIGIITGYNNCGSIGGYSSGTMQNCYWLEGTANNIASNTSNGELYKRNKEYMVTTDFLNELNQNEEKFKLDLNINNGYPILSWQ